MFSVRETPPYRGVSLSCSAMVLGVSLSSPPLEREERKKESDIKKEREKRELPLPSSLSSYVKCYMLDVICLVLRESPKGILSLSTIG